MAANILEWVTAAAAWAQPLGLGGSLEGLGALGRHQHSMGIPGPSADCPPPPKTGSMPGTTATSLQ